MLTMEMQALSLILARAGTKARRAWLDRSFSVGQTQETRGAETMDFFSSVDQPLDGEVMDELDHIRHGHRFLTEEGAKIPARNCIGGKRWVQDIIDGSSNFMTGEVDWSLSTALEQDGVPQLAAIYCPARGELVVSAEGQRTYYLNCHGRLLADIEGMIHDQTFVQASVNMFALPQTKKRENPLELARIYWHTGKRRNFELARDDPWNTFPAKLANPGCTFCCTAALVKVALGKLDGAAVAFQNHWDYAAGQLLIREAGGYFVAISRDYKRVLTAADFAEASATKTPDGDEWLCYIFAARTWEVLNAMVHHFGGQNLVNAIND